MEVCGIGGQDAGGKMDYLSDCWGGVGKEVSGNRRGQNEGSKVNTLDDDEPGTR